jgi:3-oxoacyl-(acyl-carrier-protein) synthase
MVRLPTATTWLQPSGEGAVRCMKMAMSTVKGKIDYINTHGTSTPVGDGAELKAMKEVFGADVPKFSSTKSLTGHSLGATGVQEAIYSLLMMEEQLHLRFRQRRNSRSGGSWPAAGHQA